jgi:hypothetical protein
MVEIRVGDHGELAVFRRCHGTGVFQSGRNVRDAVSLGFPEVK